MVNELATNNAAYPDRQTQAEAARAGNRPVVARWVGAVWAANGINAFHTGVPVVGRLVRVMVVRLRGVRFTVPSAGRRTVRNVQPMT